MKTRETEIQEYELAEKLAKLSGMSFAQGEYTPEQWKQKTGVNPSDFPKDIIDIGKWNTCYMTKKGCDICKAYFGNTKYNYNALGIRLIL